MDAGMRMITWCLFKGRSGFGNAAQLILGVKNNSYLQLQTHKGDTIAAN